MYTSGANVSFTMPSGGSISFSVTAKNGSTTIGTRSVTFYNYGSFMVFPNPTTTEFKIDLNKELPFTVLLQSFDGQAKKEIKDYSGGKSIDVSGLKPGDYSISIYHEGKQVSKQRLIISKK
ncbi:MAG: T9SS type A sorting domain-containing protein [Bacteroidota bacterium]|nr:T9SS type A sorting domain-containing protein [Bacteroidota bacterium]